MRNPFCDFFFPTITRLGDAGIFWILLTIVLLIIPKTRKIGMCSAIALVVDVLLCNVALKHIINRTRPYLLEEYKALGLQLLTSIQDDSSFPSGHSAASLASSVAIFMNKRKWGIAAIVLGLLIAFSRLYVAVHFPSDVFVGVILGALVGVAAFYINELLYPLIVKKCSEIKASIKAKRADK